MSSKRERPGKTDDKSVKKTENRVRKTRTEGESAFLAGPLQGTKV